MLVSILLRIINKANTFLGTSFVGVAWTVGNQITFCMDVHFTAYIRHLYCVDSDLHLPVNIQSWHLIWNIFFFLIFIRFPLQIIVLDCFFARKSRFLSLVHRHLTSYLVSFVSCIFNLVTTFTRFWNNNNHSISQQETTHVLFLVEILNLKI